MSVPRHAAAFEVVYTVTSAATRELIEERGQQDWDPEFGRIPRLFKGPESVPGLNWPTIAFDDRYVIELSGSRGTVAWNSRN
ncbi:hypothetical protein [Bordetella tumulicola]|uniref:hypothetical protein n=1 Tax=Bordetella tumulicola TaxID=1649133 RepID=UPI0039EE4BD5